MTSRGEGFGGWPPTSVWTSDDLEGLGHSDADPGPLLRETDDGALKAAAASCGDHAAGQKTGPPSFDEVANYCWCVDDVSSCTFDGALERRVGDQ